MLYDVMVNGEEITYSPTTLGKIVLGGIFAVLLIGAVIAARAWMKRQPERVQTSGSAIKQMTFCAMAIALGTVLSNVKLFEFPTGGSVTLLSMLVISLPGYFFGVGAGLLSGIAYGVLQLLIDPYVLSPVQLVVDYLLAFGAFGLSGLFAGQRNGLTKGYIAAVIGRYVFAVISGWIFFGMYAWEGWGPLPYSLAYNAIYIFTEAAVTVILLQLPQVKAAFGRVKRLALNER
ncbi:MAG: energy-coupled thiamine transporter ThiT [Roseburia sp.]|nr:energy-coupled thiamine transporter ThiT [Roseburia sp.]